MVEHFSDKEKAEGSIPSAPTRARSSVGSERLICNEEVSGSNPLGSKNTKNP